MTISLEPYNLKTWNLYRRTQQAICICSMPLNIHAFNTLNCICFQEHSNKLICLYKSAFYYDWTQQRLSTIKEFSRTQVTSSLGCQCSTTESRQPDSTLSTIKEFRCYEAKIEESETSWESNRLAVVAQ